MSKYIIEINDASMLRCDHEGMKLNVMVTIGATKIFMDTGYKVTPVDESTAEQRWISCKERLPEDNGEYLVTRKSSVYEYVDIVRKTPCSGEIASDIVAWMPSPEPYREE